MNNKAVKEIKGRTIKMFINWYYINEGERRENANRLVTS